MTEQAPHSAQQGEQRPPANPYLSTLGVGGGLVALVGVMVYVGSQPSSESEGDPAVQAFGLVLTQIGGGLLAGWLIAGAICWQLARTKQ